MKRYISAVLILCLLFYLLGCTRSYRISKQTFITEKNKDVTLICTEKDTDIEINLNADEYTVFGDRVILTEQLEHNIQIPLSDIKQITVHEFDYVGTFLIVGCIGLIALAISFFEYDLD